MRRKQMNGKRLEQGSAFPQVLLLSCAFLGGLLLGQVLARGVPAAVHTQLREYLRACRRLEQSSWQTVGLQGSLLLMYIRYPAAAFLCGLTSAGSFLLPCAAAVYGFFLSYAVSCLTITFGLPGIGIAAALLGIRAVLTVLCFFLLALPAWETSRSLLRAGRRNGSPALRYDRRDLLRLLFCLLLLGLGAWLETKIGPELLRFALKFT